jgi:ribosome-associated protein
MRVTDSLFIDEADLSESFIRAAGPGGQNVNKVSSAVQLRFNLRGSRSLPEAVKIRLARLAGAKLSGEGVLIITARRFRSQEMNRADARTRLAGLVCRAATPPKPRRATKPTRASKIRRVEGKKHRAGLKAGRARVADEET